MELISVIVPVYKVEPYLRQCVDSILNQTYTDFELILVDDGSPDNCGAICDEYASKYPQITALHRKNGGLSAARNTGIEWVLQNSSSKYITFLDSDDWLYPQYLEFLFQSAEEGDCAVAVCDFDRSKDRTQKTKHCMKPAPVYYDDAQDFMAEHTWQFNYAWGKLYRRELFQTLRYPEGKNFEDVFTTYQALFSGGKIAFVDLPLCCYFYNDAGISHSLWNEKELVIFEGMEQQMRFYEANGYDRALKLERELYIHHFAYQMVRVRANQQDWKANKHWVRTFRKQMFAEIRAYRKQYGSFEDDYCYESAYPSLAPLYRRQKKLHRILIQQGFCGVIDEIKAKLRRSP